MSSCSKDEEFGFVPYVIFQYSEKTEAADLLTTFYAPYDSLMMITVEGQIFPKKDQEFFNLSVGNELFCNLDSFRVWDAGNHIVPCNVSPSNAYNDPNDAFTDHLRRNIRVQIACTDMQEGLPLEIRLNFHADLRYTKRIIQVFNNFYYTHSDFPDKREGWNYSVRRYFSLDPVRVL
jgi:hypothetical protein